MVFLMPSHFVLLEIRDPEVNAFLWDVKKLLMGTRDSRPVHLTIRGPYVGRVPRGVLARCRSVMRHDVLRIADVGRFRNRVEQVVFFRVDSPQLAQGVVEATLSDQGWVHAAHLRVSRCGPWSRG